MIESAAGTATFKWKQPAAARPPEPSHNKSAGTRQTRNTRQAVKCDCDNHLAACNDLIGCSTPSEQSKQRDQASERSFISSSLSPLCIHPTGATFSTVKHLIGRIGVVGILCDIGAMHHRPRLDPSKQASKQAQTHSKWNNESTVLVRPAIEWPPHNHFSQSRGKMIRSKSTQEQPNLGDRGQWCCLHVGPVIGYWCSCFQV